MRVAQADTWSRQAHNSGQFDLTRRFESTALQTDRKNLIDKFDRQFLTAAMASKKVLVFVGSVRDGRHGIKVANMLVKQLQSLGVDSSLVGKYLLTSKS
jgi:hypothetical protein